MMTMLIAILLAASGPAQDRDARFFLWKIDDYGSLSAQSQGLDYIDADPRERARWAMRATMAMMEDAPRERVVVEAARLFACLNEMLTPKTEDEKIVTGMLEKNKLGELSALCATALHQGEN